MRVLIGCEESGTVREAFRLMGHDAWSCDILPTRIEGQHYQRDIMDVLDYGWDLIILHPPCTKIAVCGNSTYGEGQPRYNERLAAVEWTRSLWDKAISVCDKVCLENPVSVLRRLGGFPKPQYIQPYMFGHPEQKKTCLFLHGLQPLEETNNVKHIMDNLPKNEAQRIHYMPPGPDRARDRSKTYDGIADAFAAQWG